MIYSRFVLKTIHPNYFPKEIWNFFLFLVVLGLSVEIPLRITFFPNPSPTQLLIDWGITLLFVVDICLEFKTSFYLKRRLIIQPQKISVKYLKTFFIFDCLAAVPWVFIITSPWGILTHFLRMLRVFRSLRVFSSQRIKLIHSTWQSKLSIPPMIFRLLAFMFILLITAHWIACGWIKLGGVPGDFDAFSTYIRGYYWTVTTLTTVGYGDLTPNNNMQFIFTMVVEILGVGVYAFVIGNIASLFEQMDSSKAEYKKRLLKINTLLDYKKIPRPLSLKVKQYYAHLWEGKQGMDESEILKELPKFLKTEISLFLNRDILEKVPFLKNAEESFIRELATSLRPQFAMPGDYIIYKGDVAERMYFISEGELSVIKGTPKKRVATLTSGNFFGEASLLNETGRNADIVANTYSELYALSKRDFQRVLNKYPKFKQHINDTIQQRL